MRGERCLYRRDTGSHAGQVSKFLPSGYPGASLGLLSIKWTICINYQAPCLALFQSQWCTGKHSWPWISGVCLPIVSVVVEDCCFSFPAQLKSFVKRRSKRSDARGGATSGKPSIDLSHLFGLVQDQKDQRDERPMVFTNWGPVKSLWSWVDTERYELINQWKPVAR